MNLYIKISVEINIIDYVKDYLIVNTTVGREILMGVVCSIVEFCGDQLREYNTRWEKINCALRGSRNL